MGAPFPHFGDLRNLMKATLIENKEAEHEQAPRKISRLILGSGLHETRVTAALSILSE